MKYIYIHFLFIIYKNKKNKIIKINKKIIIKKKINNKNLHYKFIKNLKKDEVHLHSFFIEDLEKAKHLNTKNLKYYFGELSNDKVNLDSNKESSNFNPVAFDRILQPENYPLGRFPSETEKPLSFMQQTAVNLALKDENHIAGV